MRTMSTVLLGAMAILLASGFLGPSLSDEPLGVTPYASEFDREDCLRTCRIDYGFFPFAGKWRGGLGHSDSLARAYQRCVEACEKAYWKEWDSKMKDLGK